MNYFLFVSNAQDIPARPVSVEIEHTERVRQISGQQHESNLVRSVGAAETKRPGMQAYNGLFEIQLPVSYIPS